MGEPHYILLMPYYILPIFFIIFIFVYTTHAEDGENTGELNIESKTELCSANLYIKSEDNDVSEEEKEEDRKRDKIGMGETIQLTLSGKEALIGDPSKIEWKIKGEGANFVGETKGKKKVTLEISNELKENTSIKVQAITEGQKVVEGETKPIEKEFFIKIPSHITVQHARKAPKSQERGTPAVIDGFPMSVDGWTEIVGSSAQLELTFYPTNVNFQKVRIKEVSGDDKEKKFPSLGKAHETAPSGFLLWGNRLYDRIGSARSLATFKSEKHKLPQNWSWACIATVVDSKDKEILVIHRTTQFFDWRWVDSNESAIVVTVSKFEGCQSKRNNFPGNKHSYTGGQPITPTPEDE